MNVLKMYLEDQMEKIAGYWDQFRQGAEMINPMKGFLNPGGTAIGQIAAPLANAAKNNYMTRIMPPKLR